MQMYNKKTRKWKTIPATVGPTNQAVRLDPFGATEPTDTENTLVANKKFRGFTTGARDLAGNSLASNFVWTFTTETTQGDSNLGH